MEKELLIEPCERIAKDPKKDNDMSNLNKRNTEEGFASIFKKEMQKYEGSI